MYFIASVKMFGIRKTYSETFENALGIFSCFLTSGHDLLLVAVLDLDRRLLWQYKLEKHLYVTRNLPTRICCDLSSSGQDGREHSDVL